MRKIAYDTKLFQPGCVLLQAAMGGDPALCHEFDTQDWLLAPTPDLKVYPVTDEQLKSLIRMTKTYRETK